jgi:two-component system NarL family response regulator
MPLAVSVKLTDRLSGSELSDRELEVIRPIVAGKSNHHISKVLHISESTVKFHVNNILSKMGVRDRTQAAISALKRGIVTL